MSHHEAFERAKLQGAIDRWPEQWGDDLEVWLYGGITVDADIERPELGLRVSAERRTGQFVFNAPWAYPCRLKVKSRDLTGVLDAITRLETFLSAWHVTSWGRTIHYYCHLFFSGADVQTSLSDDLPAIDRFLLALKALSLRQRDLVLRAAWWLRQSQHSILSGVSQPSSFSLYSAYWNAFECLVEAYCDLIPPPADSPSAKAAKVAAFLAGRASPPKPQDIEACYHAIVNPGLPRKAGHALGLVFGPIGDQYHEICFRRKPKAEQLYQIRNDINHANIVEYNLDDRLRVENGLARLQLIVLNMLFVATAQGVMIDQDVRSCGSCASHTGGATCALQRLPAGVLPWRYVCAAWTSKPSSLATQAT
jgi:hypothetical protein